MPSQVGRFIASIPVIALLTPLSLAQQKPAAPSPHSQAQLEDRVKELETHLTAAEQKAASAAMEKDYITRVQKQYESYYEKAFNSQMWTLGIMGIILTAVFGLTTKFSMNIFDSRTKSALDAALAQMEKKLGEQNSAQLKALEDGLTKRITEQEKDLKARSDFQFRFVQGMTAGADERYYDARFQFRLALGIYKSSKPRELIEKKAGVSSAGNIFVAFKKENEASALENAKKELADELYNDLEEELALAAVYVNWLTPLLQERKAAARPAAG